MTPVAPRVKRSRPPQNGRAAAVSEALRKFPRRCGMGLLQPATANALFCLGWGPRRNRGEGNACRGSGGFESARVATGRARGGVCFCCCGGGLVPSAASPRRSSRCPRAWPRRSRRPASSRGRRSVPRNCGSPSATPPCGGLAAWSCRGRFLSTSGRRFGPAPPRGRRGPTCWEGSATCARFGCSPGSRKRRSAASRCGSTSTVRPDGGRGASCEGRGRAAAVSSRFYSRRGAW